MTGKIGFESVWRAQCRKDRRLKNLTKPPTIRNRAFASCAF